MTWAFEPLRALNYDVLVVDPPWHFKHRSKKGEKKSANAQYQTMSLADIQALPVGQLATRDATLWLWSTWPLLQEGLDTLRAWGFRYASGGVWVKRTVTGKLAFGTGYVMRSACEPFLIGRMGEPTNTRRERNLVDGLRREHSRKPDEAYAMIERWLPNAMNRADIFAREARPGWDSWGWESGKYDKGKAA